MFRILIFCLSLVIPSMYLLLYIKVLYFLQFGLGFILHEALVVKLFIILGYNCFGFEINIIYQVFESLTLKQISASTIKNVCMNIEEPF